MSKPMKATLAAACCLAAPALAQPPAPPAPAVKAAMEKLAWLEGDWEGEGWQVLRGGEKQTFNARESAAMKLDGLVLLIEGRGWREGEDGETIEGHHAIGVLSYDAFRKTYNFDAFTKEGYQTRAAPEIGEGTYSWSVPAGPEAEMQYTAQLTEDGEWVETGSYCKADQCSQTFEMRLTRVD